MKQIFHFKHPVRKRLVLYLIKPSKYDDDGYVIRYWKGVCPSNTLACLNGLSEDVRKRGALGGDLKFIIRNIDETVERVNINKIARESTVEGSKLVVCLVGVQSNQFPRASDIALAFRRFGIDVLVGGFHVSGVLSMLPEMSPEVRKLQDAGVSLVAGEVEGRWEMILKDALEGQLKPIYNFLQDKPDLATAPMPVFPRNLLNSYAVRHFATLDCSRGCPFACNFCTVINVQGRVMRFRPVVSILKMIRENYSSQKISFYFFTDDNFSRNKNWEAIFEGLIRLRRDENITIKFMLQVDTQSHRLPGFVEKAAEAGCSQVFIGLESLNEKNLQDAGKKQNKVSDFKNMIAMYQNAGIASHLAYIIGFPFDSEESVALDLERLRRELNSPQASFFMLTPLPGSLDHKTALLRGMIMDSDLNNFDSSHGTFGHALMRSGAWSRAYEYAWRDFYSVPHMIRILKQAPPRKYWDIFLNFLWYKNAIQVEGGHPMLHGFVRKKNRAERREIFPLESRRQFFTRRVNDVCRTLEGWFRLFIEMEEVWLATRHRNALEEQVVREIMRLKIRVNEWRTPTLPELEHLYRKAAQVLERSHASRGVTLKVPSRLQLWIKKWIVFSDFLIFTRKPMNRFWKQIFDHLKRGQIYYLFYSKVVSMSFRELVLFVRFTFSFIKRSSYIENRFRERELSLWR
ncbi:MAG: hypothetical protein A2036_03295 [Omnitrophica bacterium GWA2_50_21]|nr:MAG: hypothetical protein A2036_03295 [Omnitrophica bacterium GWA2_50_21]